MTCGFDLFSVSDCSDNCSWCHEYDGIQIIRRLNSDYNNITNSPRKLYTNNVEESR